MSAFNSEKLDYSVTSLEPPTHPSIVDTTDNMADSHMAHTSNTEHVVTISLPLPNAKAPILPNVASNQDDDDTPLASSEPASPSKRDGNKILKPNESEWKYLTGKFRGFYVDRNTKKMRAPSTLGRSMLKVHTYQFVQSFDTNYISSCPHAEESGIN
jgi:hypothetical protein